jgi:hypothetical protein
MMGARWRRQEAIRQARRREVNELAEFAAGDRERVSLFVCECGDPSCATTVSLSLPEYEAVRAHPKRFVIAANHENPDTESVVTENRRFAIVETLVGEASKVALRTDPRPPFSRGARP